MIEAAGSPEVGQDFRLGPWTVQPALHRLCDGETTCQVGHKVMAVLLLLAEEPGRVVRKDELIEAVWDGAFTSDEALTTVVYELRKALGDDARRPRFVETIRKGGYRLVAPVEPVAVEIPPQEVPTEVGPAIDTGSEATNRVAESVPEAATTPAPIRSTSNPRPTPTTTRRTPSLALALGGVALLAVLWFVGRSTPAGDSTVAAATPTNVSSGLSATVESEGVVAEPKSPPSLAVLPLASFGEQCRQDSFAGGLTEMLIADLAASVPMEVLPSLSTRAIDDRWSLDDIATKLDADLVVEGTVVQAGGRMWLSVQLVDIASGKMLWGGSYERSVDSLEQQRALALEIAEEVGRYASPLPTDRPDLALPPSTAP